MTVLSGTALPTHLTPMSRAPRASPRSSGGEHALGKGETFLHLGQLGSRVQETLSESIHPTSQLRGASLELELVS